ncbi:MAG: hypothetical protein Q9208_004240 [Pyrenodesmia sp. 3 TL-2023]
MGIAQFLASFRRKQPKTDGAQKQQEPGAKPTQRQPRTPAPLCNPPLLTPPPPVASVRSRNIPVNPGRKSNITASNLLEVPPRGPGPRFPAGGGQGGQGRRGTDTPPANLDARGDLGLVRFDDDLFLPPSPLDEPAVVVEDSGSGDRRPLALRRVPRGAFGEEEGNVGRTELPEEDLGARRNSEGQHFWIEHEPDVRVPAPIAPRRSKGNDNRPGSDSKTIASQLSSITLCGSISSSTNTYKISPSPFRAECTFLRPLGEGGFGKVELHRHTKTSKLLVLKRACVSHEYIKGLPAEIHVLKTIIANRHPRLPTLFHANTSLAELHIWQDYADGGDLAQLGAFFRDRRRRVPEGFVWHVLIQLSSALAYLHEGLLLSSTPDAPPPSGWEPVLHRDIKPENIFLKLVSTENHIYPNLILGDFGLATTKTRTAEVCGSPCWQPPEVPVQSAASDVWAVGAVCHCLAVGGPPMLPVPEEYPYDAVWWECEPEARWVWDVEREAGYSAYLREALGEWLAWEEERRPLGLRGVLRAEGGRTCWVADERMGGVEGLGSWWGWVRRQGARGVVKGQGEGARGFEE